MSFDMSPASPERAQALCGESFYSDEVARAICARVAGGESLRRIGAGAGWPSPQTVYKWARQRAEFGEALSAAQRAARTASRLRDRAREAERAALRAERRPRRREAPDPMYCEALTEEICRRLIEGETLIGICRDPDMPSFSTVYKWVRKYPAFEEAYVAARMLAADWLFDEGLEVTRAATPATVWADRLRFDGVRWAASRAAPKKYDGRVLAVEAAAEVKALAVAKKEGPRRIFVCHFERSPDGTEVLRFPPDGPEDEARYERHYGKPYDGPRFQTVEPLYD